MILEQKRPISRMALFVICEGCSQMRTTSSQDQLGIKEALRWEYGGHGGDAQHF
jgi:hypothetical protein